MDLSELFDRKTKQSGPYPNPLEMDVTPPRGSSYLQPETFADIEARRKKVNRLIKKYGEE
jgi:hypothetical protein